MQRELFTKRPQPYYISAPNFRRSSSGIRVMHMLADALNRSGQEAYVAAEVLNPDLMTPRLTNEIADLHRKQGLDPIVVYPEITDGNPLNGSTVVRYILNQPGFVEGKGAYGENDIFFSYTKPLLLNGMEEDRVLYLPAPDLNIFCPPSDPSKRIPGKVCYYQGRRGQAKVDPALLPPDALEITAQWPATWEELADLFQQCEFFYCTEASALGGEAALCGCLAVILPNEWAPLKLEPTAYGVAWSLEPEEIERAKSTNHLLRDRLLKAQVDFWPALDHFIEVTQQTAMERASQVGRRQLGPWLAERVPNAVQQRLISERLAEGAEPVLGVLVIDRDGDQKRLAQTISSLGLDNQLYASVKIMVLTSSEFPQVRDGAKLRFFNLDSASLLLSIESVLREVQLDWFMLVNAGCEFTQSGLMIAALDLQGLEGGRAVYADEIVRTVNGDLGPLLRPDINLDMLLSLPTAMSHHWLFNRKEWLDVGGFSEEAGDAFELDYILRLIEQAGFQGIGHISEPLLESDVQPFKDCAYEKQSIVRHLQRRGYQSANVSSSRPGRYEIDYGAAENACVSIMILLDGSNVSRTQWCMETILSKTRYANYELILLVPENALNELIVWADGVANLGSDAIKVLRFPSTMSATQMRNSAAEQARGEFLLWLDEAAAVLSEDWLQQLLNHASRQEVGAVGAKLLGGNKKVLEAGRILGLQGPVGKLFEGMDIASPGYMQRLQIDQNYVALSGQCLMLRKSLFLQAGGFDETPELARWVDADLCLRLHGAGYLNVFAPRALLMLGVDAKAQAPASVEEEDAMYARWLPQLAHDPSHNPNFSLRSTGGLSLEDSRLSWRPLSAWKPVPTVLAHAADKFGCGHYRVIQPLEALRNAGIVEGLLAWDHLPLVDLERYQPDSIVFQRQLGDMHLEHLRRVKRFSRAFKVFELDDYLPNLPVKSVHRAQMPKDILRSIRRGLSSVDRFVVSTEALAEAYTGLHSDIRVVPNTLEVSAWGALGTQRRIAKKPRVGWGGGASHTGDLEMIADVVKELAGEVEWVFFGMCPDKLRPYVHEFHPGVNINDYPEKLASLNLDLALAPVEQNLFNECKSNLRLLEYGACGFPVVCSDVVCYQGTGLPVTLVRNRFRDWVDAIRMHLNDLDETARQGDLLRAAVRRDWMLEGDNLLRWRQAWLPS